MFRRLIPLAALAGLVAACGGTGEMGAQLANDGNKILAEGGWTDPSVTSRAEECKDGWAVYRAAALLPSSKPEAEALSDALATVNERLTSAGYTADPANEEAGMLNGGVKLAFSKPNVTFKVTVTRPGESGVGVMLQGSTAC
ncbi:hypothetical protein ACIBH1_47465 [Nonomuraea sp. NPDC050663]|uniref:hypothetical protein n=1 Tax=Nonomuraea sp. NPDC050663 TaxID=3364370 RepID=UPI0037B8C59E